MNDKQKKQLKKLIVELEELESKGALDKPSVTFLESLRETVSSRLGRLFKSILSTNVIDYNKKFRRNFLFLKKELPSNNIGLSRYSLDKLNPVFANAYKLGAANSLSLITTQNEENMLKLKHRFYDWLTLKSGGQDTDKLTKAVKLPNNKRIKFILKDQTNKLSSAMDQAIADEYKALAFQWKTRNDKRVVGRPGGLYEKGSKIHGDHWSRKDKFYYYEKNLTPELKKKLNLSKFVGAAEDIPDGLPGMPIGCRCYSKNFYSIDDLPDEFIK